MTSEELVELHDAGMVVGADPEQIEKLRDRLDAEAVAVTEDGMITDDKMAEPTEAEQIKWAEQEHQQELATLDADRMGSTDL